MPGRNAYYRYELEGPVIVSRSGNQATLRWVVDSHARFDDRMSILVRLGVSAYFSQTSHVDLTNRSTEFKHHDRKRAHDPVRRVLRVENSLDINYFEEVEYHSIWHYNKGWFETEIRVTGTLLVPDNAMLIALTREENPDLDIPEIDTSGFTEVSTLPRIPEIA